MVFCGLDYVCVSSVFGCDKGVVLFFVQLHHDHRVAWSDVDALRNCLRSIGEHQGLADSTRPAPACQQLLFSFSSLNTKILLERGRFIYYWMLFSVQ